MLQGNIYVEDFPVNGLVKKIYGRVVDGYLHGPFLIAGHDKGIDFLGTYIDGAAKGAYWRKADEETYMHGTIDQEENILSGFYVNADFSTGFVDEDKKQKIQIESLGCEQATDMMTVTSFKILNNQKIIKTEL